MERLYGMWLAHPSAAWLAIGVALLALETVTGSGWLLWPAAAALLPAGLTALWFRGDPGAQWAIFAAAAIALTWIGRRYLRHWPQKPHDLNDPKGLLVGQLGEVTSVADHGQCRVFVGGKEWAAEAEEATGLKTGQRVQVLAVIGGARLQVKAAG
jgi:membrane protein implicated in regulation of membrane protease activity